MRRQAIEAVGPKNSSNFKELFIHYIARGGAEGFAEREREGQIVAFDPSI